MDVECYVGILYLTLGYPFCLYEPDLCKNSFACLFGVPSTISLSCHEQVYMFN